MKLNLLKIFSIFFILLVVGIIIFIIASDFAVAAPIIDTIKKLGMKVADAYGRISPIFSFFFYGATVSMILMNLSLYILNYAGGIGMYMGEGSLGWIFIDVGYTWILGMINMFLVIAFVFAALMHMLDVETGIIDKKTIPRLIIVAFLVNFSLLFVQLIVDFFIIFERGVVEQLLPGGLSLHSIAMSVGSLSSWITLVLLPYLNIYIQKALAAVKGALTGGIASVILKIVQLLSVILIVSPLIMEMISNSLLFIIFSILSSLFIMRSFIIYISAMLAPLAIASIIFPQTRKFFSGWLKNLLLWGAMGTIIFFVLSFGFHIRAMIIDGFNIELVRGFLGIGITGIGMGGLMVFLANFVFAVYALISLFMIKKYLPPTAQGAIGMLQKGAMLATAAAGVGITGLAVKKFAPGVEKKLGAMAKEHAPDSFVGNILEDAKTGIGKLTQKDLAQRKARLAGRSDDEIKEYGKKASEKKDMIGQIAAIEAIGERGGKINEDYLEKEWGISREVGKDGLCDLERLLGPEKFEKYKHYKLARELRAIEAKKIRLESGQITEKEKQEFAGSGKTDKEIIEILIARAEASATTEIQTSSPREIAWTVLGNKNIQNSPFLQAAATRTGEVEFNAFIAGNKPDLIKKMLNDQMKGKTVEEFIDFSKKNPTALREAAKLQDMEICPDLLNANLQGAATAEQRDEFKNILENLMTSSNESIIEEKKKQLAHLQDLKSVGTLSKEEQSQETELTKQISGLETNLTRLREINREIETINREIAERKKMLESLEVSEKGGRGILDLKKEQQKAWVKKEISDLEEELKRKKGEKIIII